MISVIVADDQAVVRAGLRIILESSPDITVVAEAADGAEAVSLTRIQDPDVVVMDIRMPILDGIEATRRIAAAMLRTRVLVLTTYEMDEYLYEALRAGATGFLIKTEDPERIIDAVRTVARGDSLLGPVPTRRLIERYVATGTARLPPPDPRLGGLTPREAEVLRMLAAGLSNQEIAAALVVGAGTVKTHVARILAKLNVRDRAQAIVVAYESGFVTPGG